MVGSMVLILAGNSVIHAHAWSKIGKLNCLRHLFGLREVTNLKFSYTYVRNVFWGTILYKYHGWVAPSCPAGRRSTGVVAEFPDATKETAYMNLLRLFKNNHVSQFTIIQLLIFLFYCQTESAFSITCTH